MTPAVLRATVITANDPQGAGRVKVQAPQATGASALWAEPMTRGAGAAPLAGSAVWVLFESGDLGLPVYMPGAAYGPWTALPAAWLGAGWLAGTAAYRLAPGGAVQYQGELATTNSATSTTLPNGANPFNLPGFLTPAVPASYPAPLAPGAVASSVGAVLRVAGGIANLYGGPWTYTGTLTVSLAALTYTV